MHIFSHTVLTEFGNWQSRQPICLQRVVAIEEPSGVLNFGLQEGQDEGRVDSPAEGQAEA